MDGRHHVNGVGGPPPAAALAAHPRPRPAAAAAVGLLLALVLATVPAVRTSGTWLVDADTELPAGAQVLQALPIADAVVVTAPGPIAGAVAIDAGVHPQSLIVDAATGAQLDSGVASTGAPAVWPTTRGERAVVALIDTGVADVPALDGAVAGEIDFSGTGGGDGYGHGTFLASVIAGRGDDAPGVAPGAGVLSLKVAGPDGSATIGSVLSALQWLHGPGRAAGLRVAALAMAAEPGTEAAAYLDRAVDRLAQHGVLVVTAAGNDGPSTLTSPATAARSLSVGAVDDRATADRADDVAADFSGAGVDRRGVAQPDVVASGVAVVGSLAPGSVIAGRATEVAPGLASGSGTSMSTAIAAGVAALASSARPDLDGDALTAALTAAGGPVDAPSSVQAALAAPTHPGNGNGNGRGIANGGGGNGNGNGNGRGNGGGDGTTEPGSIRWTSIRWTSIRWTGQGWGDAGWTMAPWGSIRWTGRGWTSTDPAATPTSIRWTSIRWTLRP